MVLSPLYFNQLMCAIEPEYRMQVLKIVQNILTRVWGKYGAYLELSAVGG